MTMTLGDLGRSGRIVASLLIAGLVCAGIADPSAAQRRGERYNEENNVRSAPSCRHFGRISSPASREAVTIRFVNRSQGYRTVMWLDFAGTPKEYRNLNPGESYSQRTYVGHVWMMVDGPGNCKEIYVARRGDRRFVMRFD